MLTGKALDNSAFLHNAKNFLDLLNISVVISVAHWYKYFSSVWPYGYIVLIHDDLLKANTCSSDISKLPTHLHILIYTHVLILGFSVVKR